MDIQFVSLPKGQIMQSQSIGNGKQDDYTEFSGIGQSNAKDLTTTTYRTIIRELASRNNDPNFTKSMNDLNIKNMYPKSNNLLESKQDNSSSKRIDMAHKDGYYNMAIVEYKNASDNINADVLYRLAGAMNKWTNLKTQIIKTPMQLGDSRIADMPLIYIASGKPFVFSDRERQNLRRFFSNGGFLIFSNTAKSDAQRLDIANSIGFELWKVLDESAHSLAELDKNNPIYSSFFNLQQSSLPEILGISINDRIVMIYEDSGYNNAWISNKYMEMGVNIITYALMTNPYVANR